MLDLKPGDLIDVIPPTGAWLLSYSVLESSTRWSVDAVGVYDFTVVECDPPFYRQELLRKTFRKCDERSAWVRADLKPGDTIEALLSPSGPWEKRVITAAEPWCFNLGDRVHPWIMKMSEENRRWRRVRG